MSRNDKHVEISKETENTYSPDKPAAETHKPELKTSSGAFGSFGNLTRKAPV